MARGSQKALSQLDELIWSHAEDATPPGVRLAEAIQGAAKEEGETQLTFWTLIADGVEPLSRLAEASADGSIREVKQAGDVGLIRAQDKDGQFQVSIWPSQKDNVFLLVGTAPVTDARWKRVERWVRRAAPRLVPFLLNDSEITGICAALAEHGRVEVSRLTARIREDDSSFSRGWREGRTKLRPTYQQALEEARGKMLRTLTLHVDNGLSLHLRRDAGATYYNGNFEIFASSVLSQLVSAADQRRNLLADRERTAPNPAETAIAVKVPDGTFDEAGATEDLIEAMLGQRSMGVAVLHRNPYLHISITDYLDGSNFDAFVTRSDEIAIHPGYRATIGALSRLTERMAQAFGGIEVAEIAATPVPTKDELLAGS
jgi:hypothetical protein